MIYLYVMLNTAGWYFFYTFVQFVISEIVFKIG